MRFEQPWILALLALAPLLAWRRREPAARFSSHALLATLRPSLRARLAGVPFWLRLAAFCLLVMALAQPKSGGDRVRETGQGIAIEMVLDRSGSMEEAIAFRGGVLTRFELAKRVLQEFVRGDRGALKGRSSDQVGIIAFALRPETVCPLTLSHDTFPGLLSRVALADREGAENRTAIGDAIALAAARLQRAHAKSRTIVLLTDGQNNAGVRNLPEAANLALRWGIRLHAIGIVGAPAAPGSATYQFRTATRYASERDLAQVTETCGGIYRGVQDGDSLKAVYEEIDRLEKSQLARIRYTGGEDRFALFAAAALLLLVLSSAASATWLRRLP